MTAYAGWASPTVATAEGGRCPPYELYTRTSVGRAVAALPRVELAALLDDPDALWRRHYETPIKLSHSSLIVKALLTLDGLPTRVAYKRSRPSGWWKAWTAIVRGSRAARAWRVAQGLLERDIATAEPVLLCEPRSLLRRGCGYLATRWIAGSTNLHLYLWDLAGRDPAERRGRVRQLAASLGRLLGRMHARGVRNRDLKALNLVVVEQTESLTTYLVDVDGVRFCRHVSDRARALDLARLAASLDMHPWITRADRLRFLRSYLASAPLDARDWKPFVRLAVDHARRIKRRMARRGKAVA
jgi:tRNA A-37 threonylcarbamoyl transferase component Bud32